MLRTCFLFVVFVFAGAASAVRAAPQRADVPISVGETIRGVIDAPRQTDTYVFSAEAGDELVVDINADALGSTLDAAVRVTGPGDSGTVVVQDDDSGDLAGAFYSEFWLRGWRHAQSTDVWYEVWFGAAPWDARAHFTISASGTYTIEVGDAGWLVDGGDGWYGPGAIYDVSLLPGADLPELGPEDTDISLVWPDGSSAVMTGERWSGDGWSGYEYSLYYDDFNASELAAFFPPGTYTLRAEGPGGAIAERTFTRPAPPPLSPLLFKPLPDATDVLEPIHAAWGEVDPALERLSVELYYAGTWDLAWSLDLPTSETEAFVPADRTLHGTDYELYLAAYTYTEPEPKLFVDVGTISWIEFRTAEGQYALSGAVLYDGRQPGPVVVEADQETDFAEPVEGRMQLAAPGAYSLPLAAGRTYYVRAFRDSDGDGAPGPYEAQGVYEGGPRQASGIPLDADTSGVDIRLEDPNTDDDDLPDWWEQFHFRDLDEGNGGNPDGDAFSNLQEYLAGTDPREADEAESLLLETGWNLISLPSNVEDPTPRALFEGRHRGSLWNWYGNRYHRVDPDQQLVPKQGYWIFVHREGAGEVLLPLRSPR